MDEKIRKKLDAFFMRTHSLAYEKDDIIVRAYDPIFGIFYLKDGYVRQYALARDGHEVTIHLFRPGAFFPMMLAFNGIENRYTFQAASRVQLWRAKPEDVIAFLKQEPDVLLDLAMRFSKGLDGLATRLETTLYERTHQQLISLLLYLASRFGVSEKNAVRIDLALTHSDLASWLGTQRETVSRSMEALKKGGLISYEKTTITIKSLKKLERKL